MEEIDTKEKSGVDIKSKLDKNQNVISFLSITNIVVALISITIFSSCEKFHDKTYEDYDLIQLKFDKEIDFSEYKTYSLADTLNIVRDTVYNGENGYPNFNIEMDKHTDGEYSAKIILAVKKQLDALGLEEVKEVDGVFPNLRVVVTSMTLKQVSRYIWYPNEYYNSWWGPGYWNNYYTWGVYSYHSSNNGSLSIDMIDLTRPVKMDNQINQVSSVWRGNYEGLVGPTYDSYTERVLYSIDDIFANDLAFNK